MYSESIQSMLRAESASLRSKLRDTELDLEDATRSRRELQQQVQQMERCQLTIMEDNNFLKVASPSGCPLWMLPAHSLSFGFAE